MKIVKEFTIKLLEDKIKEAINWIQQQNMLKESSPGTS